MDWYFKWPQGLSRVQSREVNNALGQSLFAELLLLNPTLVQVSLLTKSTVSPSPCC